MFHEATFYTHYYIQVVVYFGIYINYIMDEFVILGIEEREKPVIKTPISPVKVPEEPEVVLRRTHSFETDEK